MSNDWKELDIEQKREAPPSTCRYCGEPVYWETLPGGKKQPVNATGLERHLCHVYKTKKEHPKKEAQMPTDKGHCPHGEFILTEGCSQCIAEARMEGEIEQFSLEPALELIGEQLAEEAGIVEAEEEDASYHAPYRLQNGSIVPGVTTVLKELSQGEGMQYWAWDLGRQGLDFREVRDAAGRVGTLAHNLIACHIAKRGVGMAGYSPTEVEKAERCFRKYLAWEKENPLTPVMIEEPLVSELFKYGGTPDLLAEIDGKFVLIDFKTGGGIYQSYHCQVAAYRKLLEEQDWTVTGARIVRISPDENDRIEVAMALDLDRNFEKFKHALAIWQLDNGGEKERR